MLRFGGLAAPPVFSIVEIFCRVQRNETAFVASLHINGGRWCFIARFSMLSTVVCTAACLCCQVLTC